MSPAPRITIVTPVFNQVQFIERTILSVLSQDYPNLEYIIVDGGSDDGTIDIIRKYQSRLALFISERDGGMYDALNKGFSKSTGEIMAWLNADDLYHPGALSIVSEIFTQFAEVEWIMGQPTTFDENDRCVKVDLIRNWSQIDYLLHGNNWVIQQESTFWKRSLWERSGGKISDKYRLAGDSELWTRFFLQGNGQLYPVNALLAGFRIRKGQLSADKAGYRKELDAIYREVNVSPDMRDKLKKHTFYSSLAKIPGVRSVMNVQQKLDAILQHPPLIRYHSVRGRYEFARIPRF